MCRDDGQRCLIPPSPEARERIRERLNQLRGDGDLIGPMVRFGEPDSPGMNDGLIVPGAYFPLGTPLEMVRSAASDRAPLRGGVRVVVLLVEFTDRRLDPNHGKQHFHDLFFSQGVLPTGSVREYYAETSGGLVDIVGEVVGPYTLPLTLAEYAHGSSGTGPAQPNARTMALHAAQAANADVDFGPYDNDGNGFVDAFIVVHAGGGAEATLQSGDIWSHKWVLPNGEFNADGTKIYAYLTVPEDARIGVCCHELGHLLFGWPDLYDIDGSSEGLGNWCLMAGGSWNGRGDIPAHPSAWCKSQQEWISVVNQTQNGSLAIEEITTGRRAHRLWKNGGPGNEYFLVENRQKKNYDRELPGEGLLVYHIDDAVATNQDERHPKVRLIQADGLKDLDSGKNRGDAGDVWPGSSDKRNWNATTNPDSKSYGSVTTDVSLTRISDPGPVMKASVTVSPSVKKKTPAHRRHARAVEAAEGITLDGDNAAWQAAERLMFAFGRGVASGRAAGLPAPPLDEGDEMDENWKDTIEARLAGIERALVSRTNAAWERPLAEAGGPPVEPRG